MSCEFPDDSRWIGRVLMMCSTMIWGGESLVVSCMSDPHCREDFPEEDNPSKIQGVIPSWKMMTATYVSPPSRPTKPKTKTKALTLTPQWGAHETSWEFGQRDGDGFSFNPLGHEWALV
jgi:hypothetical protein